ncbi:MAG: tetratricopeptide repeat protein [Verrucomicrobiaceae bacterium]|nr:tetratricopeptide repeat protein [Verrucomicrobiaceae bacterium]
MASSGYLRRSGLPLILIFTLATCALFPYSRSAEDGNGKPSVKPTKEEILKAINDLKSDDFKLREAATKKIWQMGRSAEPYLRQAVGEDSAELHYRGTKILSEFKLGLYPDTPENIRNLVQSYRTGIGNAKELAINRLIEMGETDILIKLVKQENDPNLRASVATRIAANVDEVAPGLILNDQLQEAQDLLELAALSPSGMRSYSVFLLQTGKLDQEIQNQQKLLNDSRTDAELLAWMLRIRGDFTEAEQIFTKLGDTSRARETRVAAGDLQAYAEMFTDPSRRTTDTLGFAAASARLAGDMDKFSRIAGDIEQYAKALPDELDRCLNALIINGDFNRAYRLAATLDQSELANMEMWRYRFDDAFKALGIAEAKAPYDKWLSDFKKDFKVAAETEIDGTILPAVKIAESCILTGQTAKADGIMRSTAALLEARNTSLLPLIYRETQLGLDRLARTHAIQAMKLEIEGDVIDALFPLGDEARARKCWEHIHRKFADETVELKLDRMSALFGIDPKQRAKECREETIKSLVDSAEATKQVETGKELWQTVAFLARLHEQWDLAAKATGKWLQLLGEEALWYNLMAYGDILMSAGKPEMAIAQYDKAWQIEPSNPTLLYLKAVALQSAGKVDMGASLKKKATLMATGDINKRHYLAYYMWLHNDAEMARKQDELILRLANPREGAHPEALRRKYADLKLHGTAGEAATALECYMLSKMQPVNQRNVISRKAALSYAIDLGTLQAKSLLKAGNIKQATAKIAHLQQFNSSDSSMLEDIYQLLVNAGSGEKADELFTTSYATCKAVADQFPERAQHHNNLAWLLSRCAKKLDEGLKHANKAVELEPGNGAFLDTLAETHFQMGNRNQAVAISEKAVAILNDDAQVKRQLERFKHGKPADR